MKLSYLNNMPPVLAITTTLSSIALISKRRNLN
jgi:hypothetical protein